MAIINDMEAAGVIGRYAIGGAVAAFNYIEPAVTQDVDVLISVEDRASEAKTSLVTLTPILSYLADRGFDRFEKEGVVIAGWPVQFLPVASALDEEGLKEAEAIELPAIAEQPALATRVLRAEHLVATALAVGRPKDFARIAQFLDATAVDLQKLRGVLERHGLVDQWRLFCLKMAIPDMIFASDAESELS